MPIPARRPRSAFGARLLAILSIALALGSGCANCRLRAESPDLRPCDDGFAYTQDGWMLGVRHVRPLVPDPDKDPVVLCHGLGLNGTFWTIPERHLAQLLADHGYEVFIPDMRGSGASRKVGRVGEINDLLRQTIIPEIGAGSWTMDDQANYDVPAILDYVEQATGRPRVNWVGHSLGGMLMFAHLETTDRPGRIATFVGMGCSTDLTTVPQTEMIRANFGLRLIAHLFSTSRFARPMQYHRPPGLATIDKFYYTAENVDKQTVDRVYGYTLEDLSGRALKQMDPWLKAGHLTSADGTIDYANHLDRIQNPTLLIAGDGDIMVDIPSTEATFAKLGSPDKTLLRFGKKEGHVDDYGHCDLVWSRHAPDEIFPEIVKWLDRHKPGSIWAWERAGRPSPQDRP
ncbi:MAG: alpha/beta hydrolase [Isosphaeraceae bacterium]